MAGSTATPTPGSRQVEALIARAAGGPSGQGLRRAPTALRNELAALGVEVMDGASGASWKRRGASLRCARRSNTGSECRRPPRRSGRCSPTSPAGRSGTRFTRGPRAPCASASVLDLDLSLPGQPVGRIRPTIVDWVPNEQIHWKLTMLGGLVRTVRYLEIEQLAPGSLHLLQRRDSSMAPWARCRPADAQDHPRRLRGPRRGAERAGDGQGMTRMPICRPA